MPAEARFWITPAIAWGLSALNAAAALGKLLDLPGFALVLAEYRLFPPPLLTPAAMLAVAAEATVAAGLLLPALRHHAALAAAALAALYAGVLAVTLLRGIPLRNCGCFGVFLARPLTLMTPLEDVAILVLALVLARRTRCRA
jgi:hypothetical protein